VAQPGSQHDNIVEGKLINQSAYRDVPFDGQSVWNAVPLLLASSQLAKRRERQQEVLRAGPWDLVIVDEAHHARRKDFLSGRYRPNRLLELLMGTGGQPGLRDRTRCLYLLTATPMQVHPVEVWDLLKVLGLGGRWGAHEENFLDYFGQLRMLSRERHWSFLMGMLRDHLAAGGELEPVFCQVAAERLGFVGWETVRDLPKSSNPSRVIDRLGVDEMQVLEEMVRRHTPLRRYMWRSTRRLLRAYRDQGLLDENVPEREPKPVWITLREGPGEERDLYDRIEIYISGVYKKYEAERKGLGFVMTVYRRRLTSSFYALRCSLERRLDFLRGKAGLAGLLTDDDLEQDDLELDIIEDLSDEDRDLFKGEMAYVEDFLRELRSLGTDSKLEHLRGELNRIFERRDTVLVFTQYTDTMDYLRDDLVQVYGGQVACYSGRGGERWDGVAWQKASKESVKEDFRKGEQIKILLCTESASEGLNLQTCGVLINYDMPWNPMRVEQRIGRIDRIGQRYEKVWVRNYFYDETVEAIIYQRLADRIGWFEDVVGELQPILHRVGRIIQDLAMTNPEERADRMEEAVQTLSQEIENRGTQSLDLEERLEEQLRLREAPAPPVTLQDLERSIVGSRLLGPLLRPHPEFKNAHLLRWGGEELAVTFDPGVFDLHPTTVQLLSYGNPLLTALLESGGEPDGSPSGPGGLGLFYADSPAPLCLVFSSQGGNPEVVDTIGQLPAAIASGSSMWDGDCEAQALGLFTSARRELADRLTQVERDRRESERLALVEAGRQVLIRAALVELANAQNPELFEETLPYGFGDEVVQALGRHGAPFRGLLKVASGRDLGARQTHPFWPKVQGEPREKLQRRWTALSQQGMEVLQKYAALAKQVGPGAERSQANQGEGVERQWYRLPVETSAKILPFRRLPQEEVRPFENCVPLYDLRAAAGRFSEEQVVDAVPQQDELVSPEQFTWVAPGGRTRPARGLFVAQVIGKSMDRSIPDGAYCLFSLHPRDWEGQTVLAQHREIHDDDLGGHFTVKIYESERDRIDESTWDIKRVILRPNSTDPSFRPIILESLEEDELRVIAELVEVLG
jgi:hypothetical protein